MKKITSKQLRNPQWLIRCSHTPVFEVCPADPFGRKCKDVFQAKRGDQRPNECADLHFYLVSYGKIEHDVM
jgi:hypothetical protein